ncbi:MAG: response regulator, partial [bacterium]|nr:response regulator [bacterium]
VTLKNRPGLGTEFRLTIPPALATFRGVLVKCGDSHFIIPTLNVDRVIRLKLDEIKTVENRETTTRNQRVLSCVSLQAILDLPSSSTMEGNSDMVQLLIIKGHGTRIAFSVDEVLEEEEVLVKDLGKQLRRIANISGAAVLSSSEVVPILNTADIMNSAIAYAAGSAVVKMKPKKQEAKSILMVEDSITSRILLKNILESSGYNVDIAVNGREGWQRVQERAYHLVISDVEMPHMSGFQLTEKMRGDKRFEKIPVILVTGMESREHREKGIEVGANAYIAKSSFDQGNLLDVIKRLL